MTIIRTIPIWLAMLALAFNGFSRSAFILCIGDEGHLAVEYICDEIPEIAACCPSEHDDHAETSLTEDGHCGDCSDLLLRSHPTMTRKTVMAGLMSPVALSQFTMSDLARPAGGASVIIRPPHDSSPPAGNHLRTVILRL